MTEKIIGLTEWFATPPGRYLLAWEQDRFDLAVADVFGFHALQLGVPELDALRANRMPQRWLALPEGDAPAIDGARVALVTDAAALPFPEASLDLVVLPHTLELSADPHQVLREVERVLVPEGRVVLTGFNPASLWGMRQARARAMQRLGRGTRPYLPEAGEFIGPGRLRDWLRLLSFEVEAQHCGCYRPAVRTDKWLHRLRWMDRAGARWWPIFGAVHVTTAVKRVRGMRLLGPAWKPRRVPATAPVPLANRQRR
ncbi:class I SAM-dependent methyltransferase [Hydrogenophaga borbori]